MRLFALLLSWYKVDGSTPSVMEWHSLIDYLLVHMCYKRKYKIVKMRNFLSLVLLIPVSICSVTDYYDAGTGQVDLGNTEDTEWTVVRNSCWLSVGPLTQSLSRIQAKDVVKVTRSMA